MLLSHWACLPPHRPLLPITFLQIPLRYSLSENCQVVLSGTYTPAIICHVPHHLSEQTLSTKGFGTHSSFPKDYFCAGFVCQEPASPLNLKHALEASSLKRQGSPHFPTSPRNPLSELVLHRFVSI